MGSVARFGISRIAALAGASNVPATFAANALGCLLVGILVGIFDSRSLSPELRGFFITGFLGGFTTFSTFSLETLQFFRSGQAADGILNLVVSLGVGLGLVALGLAIGNATQRA